MATAWIVGPWDSPAWSPSAWSGDPSAAEPPPSGVDLSSIMVEDGLNLLQAVSCLLAWTTGVGPGVVPGVGTYYDPTGAEVRVVVGGASGDRTTVTLTPYTDPDGELVEDGVTLAQAMSSILAANLGVGPGTTPGVGTYRDPSGAEVRVVMHGSGGNRTSVELTPYEA